MPIKRQRLMFILVSLFVLVGLVIVSVSLSMVGLHNANAASTVPTHYFAPYWEDGEGDSLQAVEQKTGQKYFTLAFVISSGSCQASSLTSLSDIQALRDQGGDVIQSFGGAAGQELAQSCDSANSLQAQYQAVVTKLALKHLDFDIEGGQESDASTYHRRNTALAALQTANPDLTISFTLPAGPNGLEDGSIGLLKDAVSQGVTFNVVNLMVMDYGSDNSQMGQTAIDAANGLFAQLQGIFPQKTSSELWSMVGLTSMIGKNDTPNETFTLSDAALVLTFAQTKHIGELSFWVVSRDNPSCPDFQWSNSGETSLDTCDGISEPQYAFTKAWQPYSDSTTTAAASPTDTSTPTTSPTDTSTPDASPTDTSTPVMTPTTISTPTASPTDTSTPVMTPTTISTPAASPTATSTPVTTPTVAGTQGLSGYYYIVNRYSKKVLDDTDWSQDCGATIQQWTKQPGQANQQWSFKALGNNTYYIVNKYSGQVLDDTDWSQDNGARLQQWGQANNQANQQWSLKPVGHNAYAIVNKYSGQVLDDTDWSTNSGTMMQQWTQGHNQANQQWILQKA